MDDTAAVVSRSSGEATGPWCRSKIRMMGVSTNRGYWLYLPKWMCFFSGKTLLELMSLGGSPIFGNTHIYIYMPHGHRKMGVDIHTQKFSCAGVSRTSSIPVNHQGTTMRLNWTGTWAYGRAYVEARIRWSKETSVKLYWWFVFDVLKMPIFTNRKKVPPHVSTLSHKLVIESARFKKRQSFSLREVVKVRGAIGPALFLN